MGLKSDAGTEPSLVTQRRVFGSLRPVGGGQRRRAACRIPRRHDVRLSGGDIARDQSGPCHDAPVTRERLISLGDLPADITFAAVGIGPDGDGIDIRFSDGHAALYPADLLRALDHADDSMPRVKWDARQGAELPTHQWDQVSADCRAESLWLAAVQTYGFALLRGTPPDPDFLESLATRIGPIRTAISAGYST